MYENHYKLFIIEVPYGRSARGYWADEAPLRSWQALKRCYICTRPSELAALANSEVSSDFDQDPCNSQIAEIAEAALCDLGSWILQRFYPALPERENEHYATRST